MKYQKVLILGAKGTLGQALKEEFLRTKVDVLAWDREEVDITDKISLEEKITGARPDVIINATAINLLDKMETEPEILELAKKVNGEAVGDLAKISKKLNISLVHYSTDYIFKGDKVNGYSEDDIGDPINKYGETKLLGENLLKENTDKYYLIRISRLFGKAGLSGASKMSFVDLMLDLVLNKKKEHLDVVNEEVSSPSYAPDVSELTRKILDNDYSFGIYHGANSGSCVWYEFAKEIFKLKNIIVDMSPVPSSQFPRPTKVPKYSILLNTKLPPQRSWQDALKDYLG